MSSPLLFLIFVGLLCVAIATKHLTVVGNSQASLAPGLDVVAFHFAELKMLTAYRSDTSLTAVSRHFFTLIKLAKI